MSENAHRLVLFDTSALVYLAESGELKGVVKRLGLSLAVPEAVRGELDALHPEGSNGTRILNDLGLRLRSQPLHRDAAQVVRVLEADPHYGSEVSASTRALVALRATSAVIAVSGHESVRQAAALLWGVAIHSPEESIDALYANDIGRLNFSLPATLSPALQSGARSTPSSAITHGWGV